MMREAASALQVEYIQWSGLQRWGWQLSLALWVGGAVACGPVEPGSAREEELATEEEGEAKEGLQTRELALQTLNGLSVNGLSVNGLSVNGLSVNGLSVNGLSSAEFSGWFSTDPALHDVVMAYVVRCAMPAHQSLTYIDPLTGHAYPWEGLLGLAPDWSQGQAASQQEQQVVSACLAAHVNKFGIHVPLSVLGRTAQGRPLPARHQELKRFSEREACFFGNVFEGTGVFAANDRPLLGSGESTSRACGLSSSGQSDVCAPMAHVGFCADLCTLDATGTYYTRCTLGGVGYLPITTRIKPEEIFQCGDGVCQFTEHCGTGSTPGSCAADCGTCG